jgi:hypothetical protein
MVERAARLDAFHMVLLLGLMFAAWWLLPNE